MKKILALLLSLVFLAALFVGCSSPEDSSTDGTGTREPTPDKIVMTVGDFQITAKEYDYAYNSCFQEFYAQYYSYISMLGLDPAVSLKAQTCTLTETKQTWAEFFMEQTESVLVEIYSLYNAAIAENMVLSDENKSRIDAFVLSYSEAAAEAKKSLNEFLTEYFGAGMTEADLRGFLERRLLATQYCDQKMSSIEYTDEKYEAYYEAHKSDLNRVTFRIFTVTEDHLPTDT
ncbi:MAG: hypothetical protein IIV79_00525, partial [Clostridia bacterium]|nr:hypothetical protein [Clostridia bacterium]